MTPLLTLCMGLKQYADGSMYWHDDSVRLNLCGGSMHWYDGFMYKYGGSIYSCRGLIYKFVVCTNIVRMSQISLDVRSYRFNL